MERVQSGSEFINIGVYKKIIQIFFGHIGSLENVKLPGVSWIKRMLYVCLFSFFLVLPFYGFEKNELLVVTTFSAGLSGYAESFFGASSFGSEGFGNSSLYSNVQIDAMTATKYSLGLEYFLRDYTSCTFNIGYLERPFSITYLKNTATSNLTYYSDYRFIQFSLGINQYIGWFLLGADIDYNYLVNNNSEIIEGDYRFSSPLSQSDSTYGLALNIGTDFMLKNKKVCVFFRFDGDLTQVFPDYNYISKVSLIDITLNLSTSI